MYVWFKHNWQMWTRSMGYDKVEYLGLYNDGMDGYIVCI